MDEIKIPIEVEGQEAVKTVEQLRKELDELRNSGADATEMLLKERDALKETQDAIKGLNKEKKENDKLSEEQWQRLKDLTQLEAEQKQRVSDLSQQYRQQVKDIATTEGSYAALSATLGRLRNTYRNLSEEERNGGVGQTMLANIQDLDKELKNLDAQMGSYQRNVGNYENAFTNAIGVQNQFTKSLLQTAAGGASFKAVIAALITQIKALGKACLTLLANPIFAVIAGVTAIIMGIAKAIKSSEEQTQRLTAAFAPLSRILDYVMAGFQKLAGVMVSAIEGVGWLAGKVMGLLGKISPSIAELNAEMEKAIQLEQEAYELTKRRRESIVQEAKENLEVSELRAKANQKDMYTAQERLSFLDKALQIEKEQMKRKRELAEEELRIAQERAKRTENDAATNDELARLEAAVYNARQEYFNKERELNEKRLSFINEINTQEKAVQKEREERRRKELAQREADEKKIEAINDRLYLNTLGNSQREIELLTRKYNEERVLLERYGKDTTALTEQYEAEKLAIINKYAEQARAEEEKRIAEQEKRADEASVARVQSMQALFEEQLALINEGIKNKQEDSESWNPITNFKSQIEGIGEAMSALDFYHEQSAALIDAELEQEGLSAERRAELAQQRIDLDAEVFAKKEQLAREESKLRKTLSKEEKQYYAQTAAQALSAVSGMMGAMEGLFEEGSEEQKKMQIATAVVTGLAGVASAISTAMELGPILGPIMGAINAATVIATTAAQIRKIKSDSDDISGTGSAAAATPVVGTVLDTAALSSQLTNETEFDLQQKAQDTRVYVVEEDITRTQDDVKVTVDESHF